MIYYYLSFSYYLLAYVHIFDCKAVTKLSEWIVGRQLLREVTSVTSLRKLEKILLYVCIVTVTETTKPFRTSSVTHAKESNGYFVTIIDGK